MSVQISLTDLTNKVLAFTDGIFMLLETLLQDLQFKPMQIHKRIEKHC